MPGMEGFECLQALRRLPGGTAPRVIYAMSENNPNVMLRAIQAGADAVIVKPFNRLMLQYKLEILGII